MILPGTGRGTVRRQANGGGARALRRPSVYAARKLRREMSLPEVLLWRNLRGSPRGIAFRRQHPIDPYVADFYCSSARLIVEIDGEAHDRGDRPSFDEERDAVLRARGYRILRIAAADVLKDADGVADAIVNLAADPLHQPSAGPPPRAGKDR